ncbi:hypothetical protein EDD16DRAFT_1517771 [Pisolithus croceorrhizus]|nr:hypothetical protein EDD16DRAFT_1517771 [Pisolithus croceorrhizus]
MAHLQDVALYHDQEQDSELSKVVPQGWDQTQLTVTSLIEVGVELLEVLEDALGWLDLWVLEGYESLEAVPLLKDWGIDYEEAPELPSERWGSNDCYLHQGQDNLAGPAPAPRTLGVTWVGLKTVQIPLPFLVCSQLLIVVLGWSRSPNVCDQSRKGKMKYWGLLNVSSSVKRARKVSGGLEGSGISKWLMGSRRGFLLTLRQWGKGYYDLEWLENARGGARELGCGRRGRTAGRSRGVGRMWKYKIMCTQFQDIHKTVQYSLSAQKA